MRFREGAMFGVLMLLFSGFCGAQEKAVQEIDMHKNVRLILMEIPREMPTDLKARYENFLPMFEEVLKEKTSDRASESAVTIRIAPGIKEIGSAKTKRAIARITAYRKDSRKEFIANFLIYSYVTGETVSKEEINQFLNQQILTPMGVS